MQCWGATTKQEYKVKESLPARVMNDINTEQTSTAKEHKTTNMDRGM